MILVSEKIVNGIRKRTWLMEDSDFKPKEEKKAEKPKQPKKPKENDNAEKKQPKQAKEKDKAEKKQVKKTQNKTHQPKEIPFKRAKLLKKYGDKCAFCGRDLTPQTVTIDHFFPKSKLKAGDKLKNSMENLVPACRVCNALKGNLNLKEFRFICRKTVNGFLKRAGREEILARDFKFLFEDEAYLAKLPKVRKMAAKRKKNYEKTAHQAKQLMANEIVSLQKTLNKMNARVAKVKQQEAALQKKREERIAAQRKKAKAKEQAKAQKAATKNKD